MKRQIFINVHVKDLAKSRAFYSALGFSFNEHFCDDTAACLVISEEIHVMLLTHAKMEGFLPTGHGVCDTSKSHEALLCLSCESKDEVEKLNSAALAAGGSSFNDPVDYGFMYYRAFQDPDGHIWEMMFMDPSAVPPKAEEATAAKG